LGHRLPHLIVYYDNAKKVSYWVHVTQEAVVSTGRARKIFVPKAQTVDPGNFDALVDVATSVRLEGTWEGSAWSPGREIPSESRLRYALLVPRLVAPHGNASPDHISASDAVALAAAVRVRDLHERYASKQPLLEAATALLSDDPEWQFYGALVSWVESGVHDELKTLSAGDYRPDLRAAIAAVEAAALLEEGSVRRAIELIEASLAEHDDYNPVDFAWLTMHLARSLVQAGNLERARKLALDVVAIGRVAPSDPTARMLAGVASDMVFSLSDWQAADIESVITARDTAASWWRSQSMTSGLAEHLEGAFKSWAHDQSVTFGATDETWVRLRSATLISGFAADTSNWRYEASLLAKHMVMRELNPSHMAAALNLLRFAGNSKDLALVVNRILDVGPTSALAEVVDELELESATRDSLNSDLEFIGLSGPLLPEAVADRTAEWLIHELGDPGVRHHALALRFRYHDALVLALARIYLACAPMIQAAIRSHVVALPAIKDQSLAHNYAVLLSRVDLRDWSDHEVRAIGARSSEDNFEFADALERLVSSHDPARRVDLLERIEGGDARALSSWGDVRDLPVKTAASMISHTARAVRAEVASARTGVYTFGGDSVLRRLVLLNVWYPQYAEWAPCVEALAEVKSSANDLVPALELLASHADRLPAEIKQQMLPHLLRLSTEPPGDAPGVTLFGGSDMRGEATLLLHAVFPEHVSESRLLELLQGTSEQVVAALQIIGNRALASDLPVLAALATSDDVHIRTSVAVVLTDWVALESLGRAPLDLLVGILEKPGVKTAARVARALADRESSVGAEGLLARLEQHPSAVVRSHARWIRRRWEGQ
jgi:hypothetical protein